MGLIGRERPIEQLEWGVVGPFALTHFVLASGLRHYCQAVDVFYPVGPNEASDFFLADAAIVETRITTSTRALHLWSNLIRRLKNVPPPPASYIAKMCSRLGVNGV
jgi:hypothetical protein